MNIKLLFSIISLLMFNHLKAQFPGPVGTLGTTAIYKDSSIFVAWATHCTVQRGYMDISNPSLGFTSVGDSSMALGIAGSNGVVSLGDGGSAILTFDYPIMNGPGFDFAVFENAFNDNFLELAFVEVSSDGVNFFRFPATSYTQTNTQIGPFDNLGDATKINNLAGKYRNFYGTPFDLEELAGNPLLDINAITHVKIIDVVGSINPLYASYDSNNNPINDPFPTPFASGGFDLDAIGVIHQNTTTKQTFENQKVFKIYPNPIQPNQRITIECKENSIELLVLNSLGEIVYFGKEKTLDFSFPKGMYIIKVITPNEVGIQKIIIE